LALSLMPQPPPAVDPDLPLVRRAVAGDYGAFEELVARHDRALYTLARRIVGSVADAEEVVQETLLSVVEHLGDFAGQSTFRTWLVRIATNHALKVLRRRRTHPVVPAGSDDEEQLPHPHYIAPWRKSPDEIAQDHETRDLLADAIDRLDEKYRVVFVLRDVEGLSIEETANALGISQANTKVRLSRARLMLRERLTRALGDRARQVTPAHEHDAEK
jgi:RNA polymerase sigma-70 factor (ECF subfamily)